MGESGSSLRDQGLAAFRDGRMDEAVRLLREAVSADPRDYRAYCVLGAAHVQRGECEDAIAAFEKARSICPDAAHIHYNLGLACQRAGRLEQAVAAFQAAVEVDPSYDKARDALSGARAAEARKATPPAPPQPAGAPAAPAAPEAGSAQETPAPRRMPLAPPPIMEVAPPAPWQTPATGAQASATGPGIGLRRLGGDIPPQQQAVPGAPAPVPWATQQAGSARPPAGEISVDTRERRSSAKEPAQADYDRMGRKVGGTYGFMLTLAVVFVDYFIEGPFGIIKKGGINSLLAIFIAAAIGGYAYGVVVGLITARTRSPNAPVLVACGLWVLVAFALMIRVPQMAGGSGFLLGLALGMGYGMITGWFIANNVMGYLKRV